MKREIERLKERYKEEKKGTKIQRGIEREREEKEERERERERERESEIKKKRKIDR